MTEPSDERKRRDETDEVVFFREVAVDELGLVMSRFLSTAFGWRCPACAKGRVSSGLLEVRDSCGVCGSRFKRLEGNELISISVSFFLASVVTFLVGLLLVLNHGFFDGITWLLLAVGIITAIIGLKPVRVLSLWLLWIVGFVYPDRVPRGKSEAPLRLRD